MNSYITIILVLSLNNAFSKISVFIKSRKLNIFDQIWKSKFRYLMINIVQMAQIIQTVKNMVDISLFNKGHSKGN